MKVMGMHVQRCIQDMFIILFPSFIVGINITSLQLAP